MLKWHRKINPLMLTTKSKKVPQRNSTKYKTEVHQRDKNIQNQTIRIKKSQKRTTKRFISNYVVGKRVNRLFKGHTLKISDTGNLWNNNWQLNSHTENTPNAQRTFSNKAVKKQKKRLTRKTNYDFSFVNFSNIQMLQTEGNPITGKFHKNMHSIVVSYIFYIAYFSGHHRNHSFMKCDFDTNIC